MLYYLQNYVQVYFDGYHGDCSDTVMVGDVDDKGRKLVEAARTCLYAGISVCAPGVPFNKIGKPEKKLHWS